MNARRLLEILQSMSDKDLDEITVVTMPTHSQMEVTAVIVDREGRIDRDYSFVRRPVLYLNDMAQVAPGYFPEILC